MAEVSPKSLASKHASLPSPATENGFSSEQAPDTLSIASRDYQPQLTSGSKTSQKGETQKRLENVVRVVRSKQFRKVAASCLQAGCAGWNGELLENGRKPLSADTDDCAIKTLALELFCHTSRLGFM